MKIKNVVRIPLLILVWFGIHVSSVKRSDDPNALEVVVQQLSTQLAALESKVTAVQNSLHTLQDKENQHVVFTATISQRNVKSAPSSTIPFQHLVTNVGNAYDPHTSIFTTPYDGQYMLFVTVDVSPDYKVLEIVKDGHVILYGHNDAADHHIYSGGAVNLKRGDKVWVIHGPTNGTVDGGAEAVFSGFKI